MPTVTLVAGSHEPEPDDGEMNRGFEELSAYLEIHRPADSVRDVGRGILALGEQQFARGLGGRAVTPFVVPKRVQPRQVSPGVYTL